MKQIGHIYLSWRKGLGERRHIVGVIKHSANDSARFSYLKKGVEKAKTDGFLPYTEFQDTSKTFTENVLEIFGQRLMKSERSDIQDFYSFWEIDPKYKDNKLYMLAYTQGFNPSDNFEFLVDFNPTNSLVFVTDLAGLSSLKLPKDTVKLGQELKFELELGNQHDEYAVKVLADGQHIGYIKKIHNRLFHKLKNKSANIKLQVKAIEQNGIMKRVFVKVSTVSW